MSEKTKQILQEIRELRQGTNGPIAYGARNQPTTDKPKKLDELHKNLTRQLEAEMKAVTIKRRKLDQKEAEHKAKQPPKDYERLNFERARIEALVKNAKDMNAVQSAFKADSGDRELLEIWKTFAPAALQDKSFPLQRADSQNLRQRIINEIEYFEVPKTPAEEIFEALNDELGAEIAEIYDDVSTGAILYGRVDKTQAQAFDSLFNNYFEKTPLNNTGKVEITFLKKDKVDPNADPQLEIKRAEVVEDLLAQHKQQHDHYKSGYDLRVMPSELSQREGAMKQTETMLQQLGQPVPQYEEVDNG